MQEGVSAIAAEAGSLQFQHRLFLREMGGVFPELLPIEQIHRVLDVRCGCGAWMIDVAKAYPHLHITGIDTNVELLRMANEDIETAGVTNVTCIRHDIINRLPFAENSFDFIHLLMGSEVMIPQAWPSMIAELLRVQQPGGWVNLLDFEPGPTSSPGLDTLYGLISKALSKAGFTIAPEGIAMTSAVWLPRMLSQAGYVDVSYSLHAVDMGNWNNPAGRAFILTTLAYGGRVIPLLLRMGVITSTEVHNILQTIRQEVQQMDFCSVGMLISVVGRKPVAGEAKG